MVAFVDPLAADDPRQVAGFRLHARLGAGGMGRVYLGYSPGGQPVAVKVVHPDLARDPEFMQRFRREVSAAQAVSDAYTAAVVGAGPDDSPPWLATTFVPGPSLAALVVQAGPLPEDAVWRLAGAFLLRLFLIRFPYMFTLDVNTFRAWGDAIIKNGPTNFYNSTWSDYPPLFMYFLWVWGLIQMPFTHSSVMSVQWAKLPACIADVINAGLIYHLLKGRVSIRSAFRTAIFYASNLGNSSSHDNTNLPIILAGGGFRHAGHVAFDRKNNALLSNLFVRMLHQMGVEAKSFGASTGVVGEV